MRALGLKAWGLGIYRFALAFGVLIAGFHAFPGYKTFVALAFLFINTAFIAVFDVLAIHRLTDNTIMDMAERKTRHTILLAQERGLDGIRSYDDYTFWREVDRRVADEDTPEVPAPKGWWRAPRAVALDVLGRALADLILIVVAAALSS